MCSGDPSMSRLKRPQIARPGPATRERQHASGGAERFPASSKRPTFPWRAPRNLQRGNLMTIELVRASMTPEIDQQFTVVVCFSLLGLTLSLAASHLLGPYFAAALVFGG